MATVTCPSCESKFILGVPARIGNRVVCDFCEVELEIISLKPLDLDWPLYEDTDYYDDGDFDYDYDYDQEERW